MSLLTITDQFTAFLNQKALRATKQRTCILAAALSFGGPFTAEQLFEKAKQLDPSNSRATLYRTLNLMVESQLFREIDAAKDHKYYVLHTPNQNFQAQIICSSCDKILEIDAPFMHWYSKTAAQKMNMEALSARLQVTACCHGSCWHGK